MKKILSLILSFVLISSANAFAVSIDDINSVISDTEKYLYDNSQTPTVSSIGGEWLITGLSRNSGDIQDSYYEEYYNNVVNYVKECGGVLHNKKYTEYSRVIIALTSIGKDPQNVGGYNLLLPLGDFEKTTWQGINGAIWALIALDCGQYDIPYNADAQIHATREMYVEKIINSQLDDGGWSNICIHCLNSKPVWQKWSLGVGLKNSSKRYAITAVSLVKMSRRRGQGQAFQTTPNLRI